MSQAQDSKMLEMPTDEAEVIMDEEEEEEALKMTKLSRSGTTLRMQTNKRVNFGKMRGAASQAADQLSKDKSFVNRLIFPSPRPPFYDIDSFGTTNGRIGRLFFVPRKRAAVPRSKVEHVKDSAPCLLMEARGGSDKVMLFCHGNSEDLGNAAALLARLRDVLKVHVIGVEYPGYGFAHGKPSEGSVNETLLAVYQFLIGIMKWKPENIYLFGYSIGTGACTYLASRRRVGMLMVCAPYLSIREMVKCILPKNSGTVLQYVISDRFVSKKNILTVTCPTLFLHGKEDSLIPWQHAAELHSRSPSTRKAVHYIDGMDHCFNTAQFEVLLSRMVDFFTEHNLMGPDKGPSFGDAIPAYAQVKP